MIATTIGDYVTSHGGYGTLVGIIIGALFVVGIIAAVVHDESVNGR